MIDQTYSEAGLEAGLRRTLKQVHFPGLGKRIPEAGYPETLQDSVGPPENQTLSLLQAPPIWKSATEIYLRVTGCHIPAQNFNYQS